MTKSPSILTKTLLILAVAGSMAAFFVQPAAAQTATGLKCNGCIKSKQIKNGKVKGKDLKDSTVTGSKIAPDAIDGSKILNGSVTGGDMSSDISLGTSSSDGDLSVKNTAGEETVSLDGATGNVTNLFANVADSSNGLVKAWARINADGTIASCFRCNTDPIETRRVSTGQFEVDFTPLGADITERPRMVMPDSLTAGIAPEGIVRVADRNGDPSSVFVGPDNLAGTGVDLPFVVIIF